MFVIQKKSDTGQTVISQKKLEIDLSGITPQFVDKDQPITPELQKVKDDVIAFLTVQEPGNAEYYSQILLVAVGKRYILISQPSAASYYDEIVDSQTGKITPIPGGTRYYLASEGRNIALYIDNQHIYTYTIDQPSTVLVSGSQLSGSETYHSGEADMSDLIPHEMHTQDSITITVFDMNKRVLNTKLGEGATMNGKVREITLAF